MSLLTLRIAVVLGGFAVATAPRTARAEPPKEDAPAQASAPAQPPTPAPARVERNSIPMMITGIGLTAVGVIAVGVGTGLMIQGHQNCDRDAASKVDRLGLSPSDASALYGVAEDVCVGESAMINGGMASLIGGSVFAAAGVAFTIAGAWKVTVPERAAAAPSFRIGLASVVFSGSF